jgi:predicted neuraminidase
VSEFLNETASYPQCHASTIAEVSPGRLVAAWFGGTREGAPDVGIWVTRFESGRWARPVEVANGVQPDGTRHPTWNPVLFAVPGQPLRLFYKVGPSPRAWWGMVKTSADGGRTERGLPAARSQLGPIKNKPVVTRGRIVAEPSSMEDSPTGWRVHVERSGDAGRTWESIGPIGKEPEPRGDSRQCPLPSGRPSADGGPHASGVVFSARSADGGRTGACPRPRLPIPTRAPMR